eukprot:Rhum_TRINITY_DN13016_c1_g1::Rhum_TRINITY_DN13016_c1_g1_i1::g.56323::m.56323/K08853/AAK; AP2-associated kinase
MNAVKNLFSDKRKLIVDGVGYRLTGDVVGEGGFGRVVAAEYDGPDGRTHKCAIKRSTAPHGSPALAALRQEVAFLRQLRGCAGIVSLVASDADAADSPQQSEFRDVSVVMELCGATALALSLKRTAWARGVSGSGAGCLPPANPDNAADMRTVCDVMLSACEAVAALHGQSPPIAHRDLKLDNLLYAGGRLPSYFEAEQASFPPRSGGSGGANGATRWKLCDLGSATTVAMKCLSRAQVERGAEEIDARTTLAYRSPEMVDLWRQVRVDQQSDVWSLGVMFHCLLCHEFPFEEKPLAILNGKLSLQPALRGHRVEGMLHAMLAKEPAHRPDIWALTNQFRSLRYPGGLGDDAAATSSTAAPAARPANWTEQPLASWCTNDAAVSFAPGGAGGSNNSKSNNNNGNSAAALFPDPMRSFLAAGAKPRIPSPVDGGDPIVAPSTPTRATAGVTVTAFGVEEKVEALRSEVQHAMSREAAGAAAADAPTPLCNTVENPVIDDFDEAPRVHYVTEEMLAARASSDSAAGGAGGGASEPPSKPRVDRTISARLKDWAEKRGFSEGALKVFHSDTPHGWVIRSTDTSLGSLKTLYLSKLVAFVEAEEREGRVAEAVQSLAYYIRLRPIFYNSLVAYKSLYLLHHLQEHLSWEAQKVIASFGGVLFGQLAQKWAGVDCLKDDEAHKHFPLLHALVVLYSEYLAKRVAHYAKAKGLTAGSDEDAALLGDLFRCGVECLEAVCPPLTGARRMHSAVVVKLVADLLDVDAGLARAPKSGQRWAQVAAEVDESRAAFARMRVAVEKEMPEVVRLSGRLAAPPAAPASSSSSSAAAAPAPPLVRRSSAPVVPAPLSPPHHADPAGGRRSPMFRVPSTDNLSVADELYFMFPLIRSPLTRAVDVARLVENRLCFDCRSTRRAVAFASSLGVFLCPLCVEFHEILPFSECKSLGDHFTQAEIDHLHRVGNINARHVWMGGVDEVTLTTGEAQEVARAMSLDPGVDPEGYQEFIYDKYVLRRYMGRLGDMEESQQVMTLLQSESPIAGGCTGSGGFDALFGTPLGGAGGGGGGMTSKRGGVVDSFAPGAAAAAAGQQPPQAANLLSFSPCVPEAKRGSFAHADEVDMFFAAVTHHSEQEAPRQREGLQTEPSFVPPPHLDAAAPAIETKPSFVLE